MAKFRSFFTNDFFLGYLKNRSRYVITFHFFVPMHKNVCMFETLFKNV